MACGLDAVDGGGDAVDAARRDSRPTATPYVCADVYDPELLVEYAIELSPTEWAALEEEFADPAGAGAEKPYHPLLSFRYGDEVVTDAMIRLRGNPSFSSVGDKMQFVISFKEVDPNQRFHGLRKIVLDAAWYDPSMLHERLASAFLRNLGIPAPCANHARLVVNGDYYGVYTHLEQTDRGYLERNFPDAPDGNLYKDGQEKTANEGDPDTSDRDAFWATTDVGTLATLVDLEASVTEWAAEAMIPHGKGYWCCGLSFYLYNLDGKLIFLASDINYAFDGSQNFLVIPVDADPLTWVREISEKPPHFAAVLAEPEWRSRYLEALAAASASYDVPALQALVDAWSAQIASAVAEDSHKPFTDDEHMTHVALLRAYLADRAAFVADWLASARE
jgi:hypothetical protein